MRPIRMGITLSVRDKDDNKENMRANHDEDKSDDDDSDGDGPVLYKDEEEDCNDSQDSG